MGDAETRHWYRRTCIEQTSEIPQWTFNAFKNRLESMSPHVWDLKNSQQQLFTYI